MTKYSYLSQCPSYVQLSGPTGTLSPLGPLSPNLKCDSLCEGDAEDAKRSEDAPEIIEKDPILFEKVKKIIRKAKQCTSCTLSFSDRWRLNYIQTDQVSKTLSVKKDGGTVNVSFGLYAWDGASEDPEFVRETLSTPIDTFHDFADNVASPINIGLNLFVMAAHHPHKEYLKRIQRNKAENMPCTHAFASFFMTFIPVCVFVLQIFFFAAFSYYFCVSEIPTIQKLVQPSLNSTSAEFTCSATEWSSGEIIAEKIVAGGITIWYSVCFWNRALDSYMYTLRLEYGTARSCTSPKLWSRVLPRERLLNFAVCDWWVAFIFNHMAKLLNVFFVMSGQSVLEMVFNSIAVDFVSSLDDAYKERFFANEVIREYMTALCLTTVTAIPNAMPTTLRITDGDYFKKRCCCLSEMKQVYVTAFLPAILAAFGAVAVFICK